jgi:hypothetical protein
VFETGRDNRKKASIHRACTVLNCAPPPAVLHETKIKKVTVLAYQVLAYQVRAATIVAKCLVFSSALNDVS